MKVTARHIAHALAGMTPSLSQEEIGAAVDAAVLLVRRHGLLRQVRTFPGLVAQALSQQRGVQVAHLTVGYGDPQEATAILEPGLQRLLGKACRVDLHEDPDLLGGATLRIGDDQIDGTLRSNLNRLSAHLTDHGSISLTTGV